MAGDIIDLVELESTKGGLTIVCAFCQGAGRDPFGAMSALSKCQVCRGRGTVTVAEPARECAFCAGTGVHPGQRITCVVCRGKGMVSIREPAEECPHCDGMGVAPSESLPCIVCKGKGVIPVEKRG